MNNSNEMSENSLKCGHFGGMTDTGKPCENPTSGGRCYAHVDENQSDMPDPPDSLGLQGMWLWYYAGPKIMKAGYMKEMDLPLFEQACEAYELGRKSFKTIQEEGRTIKDKDNDTYKRHPEMLNYRQMNQEYRSMTNKLGLNPNARSQIGIPESANEGPEDEMEKILEQSG